MAYTGPFPIIVADGGTGASTLTGLLTGNGVSAVTANAVTQNGVLIGGASNAASSLTVAATGTVLAGVTASAPAFTATPSVTSITLGTGTALSVNIDNTSFTPTMTGGSTAGVTTYTSQQGYYTRIGNTVFCSIAITWSAATGTGDMIIGNLPFTIKNQGNYFPTFSVRTDFALTAATVNATFQPQSNTITALVVNNTVLGAVAIQQITATGGMYSSFFYII